MDSTQTSRKPSVAADCTVAVLDQRGWGGCLDVTLQVGWSQCDHGMGASPRRGWLPRRDPAGGLPADGGASVTIAWEPV